jgi:endoglucanase
MQEKELTGNGLSISRRTVLNSMAGLAAASACSMTLPGMAGTPAAAKSINPKWYGFNLLEYFSTDQDWMKHFPYKNDGMFLEDDFRWIKDWGFNWVRLPMDYRFWTAPNDLMKIDEKMVEPIDRAIRLGEKYGIHVNISLHRAPGECILDACDEKFTGIHITPEKTSVYNSQATLDAFVHQWTYFAARYKGISNEQLSFNLVNEPVDSVNGKNAPDGQSQYVRVARAAIEGIREKDPARLIVTDGYPNAGSPIPELYDTGIIQSCHDYSPYQLTCYLCEWARPNVNGLPRPTWPLQDAGGKVIADKHTLEDQFRPWGEVAQHGIPIHFGELGCDKYTAPNVANAWFNDTLDVINSLHSGWALWNFRGPFGIVDTDRAGTDYKNWHGHKLDFTLLKILQSKMNV